MKAKKIVKEGLKNPALRRMRKNFRDVIKFAVKQELSRLYAVSREHRNRSSESTSSVEKYGLEQKGRAFMKDGRKLRVLLSRSIIQCGLGGGCSSLSEAIKPTSLDMVWIPFLGAWFCTKRSESLINGDKVLRKERHPDYMRQLREGGFL